MVEFGEKVHHRINRKALTKEYKLDGRWSELYFMGVEWRTGVSCKEYTPTTENWLRKRYNYSLNNDTSTEVKHETNHINNKCNDMNMNTRKMHIT